MAAAASEPDRCGYAMSSFRFIVDSVWRVFEFLTRKTDIVDGTCVSDKLTEKPPDEGNMSQLCSRNTPWIVEARDTTITERRMTRSTVKPSLMMVKSNDKANKKAAIRQSSNKGSTFFHYPRRSLRLFNHDVSKKTKEKFKCTRCKRTFFKMDTLRKHYVQHILAAEKAELKAKRITKKRPKSFSEKEAKQDDYKVTLQSSRPPVPSLIQVPIGRYLCCHCPDVDSLMTGADLFNHINTTHGITGGLPFLSSANQGSSGDEGVWPCNTNDHISD